MSDYVAVYVLVVETNNSLFPVSTETCLLFYKPCSHFTAVTLSFTLKFSDISSPNIFLPTIVLLLCPLQSDPAGSLHLPTVPFFTFSALHVLLLIPP